MALARMRSYIRRVPLEAVFWGAALGAAASIDPQSAGLNLCLLEHLGLPCPGDGLGRGIALLARGQFAASWAMHPLAGPAVIMILGHVGRLCWQALNRSRAADRAASLYSSSPSSASTHV